MQVERCNIGRVRVQQEGAAIDLYQAPKSTRTTTRRAAEAEAEAASDDPFVSAVLKFKSDKELQQRMRPRPGRSAGLPRGQRSKVTKGSKVRPSGWLLWLVAVAVTTPQPSIVTSWLFFQGYLKARQCVRALLGGL